MCHKYDISIIFPNNFLQKTLENVQKTFENQINKLHGGLFLLSKPTQARSLTMF